MHDQRKKIAELNFTNESGEARALMPLVPQHTALRGTAFVWISSFCRYFIIFINCFGIRRQFICAFAPHSPNNKQHNVKPYFFLFARRVASRI